MAALTDEVRLKQLIKDAVREALDERQELIRSAVAEAVEDIALSRAMDAADSEYASREKINESLNRSK